MRPQIAAWGLCLWATLLARPAHAHPIDEVQSQALIDLQSRDGKTFEATVFLSRAHIEAYAKTLEQLNLPPERFRQELGQTVRQAFSFDGCAQAAVAPDRQVTERAGGQWTGIRFEVRCPQAVAQLKLNREQYNRDKTRTTLLWTVEIAGRDTAEALIAPHVQSLTLDLANGQVVGSQRGGKSVAFKDTVTGQSPADARKADDLPQAGQTYRAQRPPWPILQTWAEEGALHLLTGLDHLLFLLTLVLAAQQWRGLLAGVTGFSLGHLASMAATLRLGLPPLPWVDVVIGGTIALSAWRAVAVREAPAWHLGARSLAFGLVHGLGFGQGLAALTQGVDSLWWPLVSFGLGLDAAQTAWVALGAGAAVLWRGWRGPVGVERARMVVAWGLGAAGVVLGILAAV